jgi:DNA-binding FrmR family transcriptional regulator
MNRVAAITGQIDAIAEHITGSEGYSLDSLRQVRDAIPNAHDCIAGETIKRGASNDYRAKHDGGAA